MRFKYTKVYPYYRQPVCPICETPISKVDRTNLILAADPPIGIFVCPSCKNEVSVRDKDFPNVIFREEEIEDDVTFTRE